jgi:2-polyprenyl-3-methyl-5-hydroxy-6-metoxy-1,4-benzoquinol methylase
MPSSTRNPEPAFKSAMRPSDVPTGETLAFVLARVPPPPARVLEVGCGAGALAMRLVRLGYAVVALDSAEDAVARARKRGLDARRADWPVFTDAPFDIVLFTRSLHHIPALTAAVARAKELLNPNGRVLVEDFARHAIQPLGAEWLHQILAVLHAADLLERDPDGLLDRMLQHRDAMDAWWAAHDHDLHSAEAMLEALHAHFPAVEVESAPYLYRYACARLEESERGYRIAARILELERRFAAVAGVPLIGRRFTAKR